MIKRYLPLALAIGLIGCGSVNSTTPPTALAPGYTSQADQTFGQSLAAARALANQAVTDFGTLTPAQQAQIKNPLNGFVAAVNAADAVYTAFHSGQATQAQVQATVNSVNTSQATYTTAASGVK